MKTNQAGIALIQQFEGFSLDAYADPRGIPTIGYGATGPDITLGMSVTKEWADDRFATDLFRFERAVEAACTTPMNDNQFSACVSLCYNIGPSAFRGSSVLKFHNLGQFAKAAESFLLWNKATGSDGKKRELQGLTRRRAAESGLYLTPVPADFAAEPQRGRASDVEPSVATGAFDQKVTRAVAIGGGLSALATTAGQILGQIEGAWVGMQDRFGPYAPHILLAALGIAAIAAIGWTAYSIGKARNRG